MIDKPLFDGSEYVVDRRNVLMGVGGGVEMLFQAAADFVVDEGGAGVNVVIVKKVRDSVCTPSATDVADQRLRHHQRRLQLQRPQPGSAGRRNDEYDRPRNRNK